MNRRAIRSTIRGFLRYVFGRRGQRRVFGWRLFYRLRTEVLLQTKLPIAGISHFPRTRLWVDQEAFPRIKKLLMRAQHTVVIQMFIWKDDTLGRQMASLLLKLADRGVKVYITKEATGDVFEMHRDFLTTSTDLGGVWKEFWNHPNINITYSTNLDHAKVFIIDDKILMLTGMNIADEYHERLHDYLVELHGSGFVEEYLTHGELRHTHRKVRLCMNSEFRRDVRQVVMELLENARHTIVLEQCYISDPKVTEMLIRKSKEGVRITLIVPVRTDFQHHHANMHTATRLISEGESKNVQVFLFPRMFHGKTLLVDRNKAFVGSVNMITSSLDDMGEVNVLVEGGDDDFILKLRDILRHSIFQSEPLTSPPRMHWIGRILGWLKL